MTIEKKSVYIQKNLCHPCPDFEAGLLNIYLFLMIILIVVLTLSVTNRPLAEDDLEKPSITITKCSVKSGGKSALPYRGAFRHNFPEGMAASPGSGLCFRGISGDGAWLFWGLTDRGPNYRAPVNAEGINQIVFMIPDFNPSIVELRLYPGKNEVLIEKSIPLTWEQGGGTGLPPPPKQGHAPGEIPLGDDFTPLGYDSRGIDPEGIALSPEGFFWICEEYRPSLIKADPSGRILTCLTPGQGLPSFLALRSENEGLEGITITPEGKILTALQGPLPGAGEKEDFVRFLQYDERIGRCRAFAYPLDASLYKGLKDVRISDLAAIDSHHILVLEQGKSSGGAGKIHFGLYLADLEGASDLLEKEETGDVSWEGSAALRKQGARPVAKRQICELGELGWDGGYAEGLAIINDHTIAIIEDSDFGAESHIVREDGRKVDGDSKKYTMKEGALYRKGAPTRDRYAILPAKAYPTMFIIRLSVPVKDFRYEDCP